MKLKLKHCMEAYQSMKNRAQRQFEAGDLRACWEMIDHAAVLACQIIWQYADPEMEDMLSGIAQKTIDIQSIKKTNPNRVVFFDSFGVTYILTLQYIKALVAMGKEVLYVYEERDHEHTAQVPTLDIVKTYKGVEIAIVQNRNDKTQKLQEIYNLIIHFEASAVFTHIDTHSAVIPVLSVLPTSIIKYHINLGDHLFWFGAGFIDYCYEFRSFGAEVSQHKRGLKPQQTLLLPYYPIRETKVFQGFPLETEGKVVLFTGGDFYKTIDRDNSYWELLKSVVNENDEVVVLFSCKHDNGNAPAILSKFIVTNGFEKKVIPLGFRPDINEVFAHCDIYMGTSPMSGGLMSQYAAANAKPILQYYPPERFPDNETESVICVHKQIEISFTDKRAFLDEACKLINNADYRISRGNEIKSCMLTEPEFNQLFAISLSNHISPVSIKEPGIHYNALTQWWLDIGNQGYFDAPAFIYAVLGLKGFKDAPLITLTYLYDRHIVKKIFNPDWYLNKFRL